MDFGVFCSAGSGRPVARFGKGGGQAFIAGWERVRAILANELPICAEGITERVARSVAGEKEQLTEGPTWQ